MSKIEYFGIHFFQRAIFFKPLTPQNLLGIHLESQHFDIQFQKKFFSIFVLN